MIENGLRAARQAAGLSQGELATRADTTNSDTGRFPVFAYRSVNVTTSPDCTIPAGSTLFVTVSGQNDGYAVSTSGSTTAAVIASPST